MPALCHMQLQVLRCLLCCSNAVTVSRLQIISGKVYVVPPSRVFQERPKPAQVQLAALALRFDLPDVDFMLSTTDICPTAQQPHPSHNISTEKCPGMVRGMVISPIGPMLSCLDALHNMLKGQQIFHSVRASLLYGGFALKKMVLQAPFLSNDKLAGETCVLVPDQTFGGMSCQP